ncbi:hypothetical protein ACF1AB_16665 [Streptomyces sp. NPDC014846]|uniref:hypothetical protein n=1 Tax=Streptomyces sp. NPDC014846 TaxID=3364922 RepID=UPI0036FA8C56
MRHRITIHPEHHNNGGPYGRYTYSWLCSCGAKGYALRSRPAAEHYGNEHVSKQGDR